MHAPSEQPVVIENGSKKREDKGYALLTVLIVSVIILTGATTLALLARDSSRVGSTERKGTAAHAVAVAGLTWATSNLVGVTGTESLQQAVDGATIVLPGGVRLHPFDPDEEWAGIGLAPPPVGVSNPSWQAFGDGHYALLAARDPIDPTRAGLVRSYGVVKGVKVLLESSLIYNVLTTMPGAITGCFDEALEVTWYDQSGPYDYVANMRIDGGLAVPFAMSADHNRVNGLARKDGTNPSTYSIGSEPRNRSWRGTQSLRSEAVAATVTNKYGGTRTPNLIDNPTIGYLTGWEKNPFHTNDPRIVDTSDFKGVGLSDNGAGIHTLDAFVWAGGDTVSVETAADYDTPSVPLIATRGGPDTTGNGDVTVQAEWDGVADPDSRKGFYACDNHDAEGDPGREAVEGCVKGTIGDSAPDFDGDALNHSGRAWGFIQSILRQCTGSGDAISIKDGSPWLDTSTIDIDGAGALGLLPANPNGVKCSRGFEWLENVAACLILPGNVSKNPGTNARRPAGDGNNFNNFRGCHPGCVIATDIDGDGDITAADRPFRSSCINLDETQLTTYGPGVFSMKKDGNGDGTTADVFRTPGAPVLAPLTAGSFDNTPRTTCRNIAGTYTAGDPCSPYVRELVAGVTFIDAWQFRNYPVSTLAATVPPVTSGTNYPNFGGEGVVGQFRTDSADNLTAPVAASTNLPGGAVTEWGNMHYITRFDMSDRGPLGTCEQNCLAYGFGRDRTYGAHRTDLQSDPNYGSGFASPGVVGNSGDTNCMAVVPAHDNPGTTTVNKIACNTDYDNDGFLDRKSYALVSSYRETCADDHDGIPYSPVVNISSSNGNLAGAGCLNDMPNRAAGVNPVRIKSFCEDGGYQELIDAVSAIESVATSITSNELNKTTNIIDEGSGWFGGAKCHMGGIRFRRADNTIYDPHPHGGNLSGVPDSDIDVVGNADYWLEDECPNPGIWRVDSSANINVGYVCGCGIIIFTDNTLQFDKAHFLWRGLVVWNLKTGGGDVIKMNKQMESSFVVQGGMLMTGTKDWRVTITKEAQSGSTVQLYNSANKVVAKQAFRYDREALDDVFNGLRPPIRSVRRIH